MADVHLADQGANALSALHVGQLVTDAQGMVWASTGNHVDRINPKTMKVEAVPAGDVVNYLMADARGNVWMGSNGKVRCYVIRRRCRPCMTPSTCVPAGLGVYHKPTLWSICAWGHRR